MEKNSILDSQSRSLKFLMESGGPYDQPNAQPPILIQQNGNNQISSNGFNSPPRISNFQSPNSNIGLNSPPYIPVTQYQNTNIEKQEAANSLKFQNSNYASSKVNNFSYSQPYTLPPTQHNSISPYQSYNRVNPLPQNAYSNEREQLEKKLDSLKEKWSSRSSLLNRIQIVSILEEENAKLEAEASRLLSSQVDMNPTQSMLFEWNQLQQTYDDELEELNRNPGIINTAQFEGYQKDKSDWQNIPKFDGIYTQKQFETLGNFINEKQDKEYRVIGLGNAPALEPSLTNSGPIKRFGRSGSLQPGSIKGEKDNVIDEYFKLVQS